MSNNPQPGDIITVQDFMDCLVHFLMPPVPAYQDKITLVFADGLKMSVKRDQIMGLKSFGGFEEVAGDMRVGDVIPEQYIGAFTGRGPGPKSSKHTLIEIIDPSDNTVYHGIDKHTFEAKMPVPGELISVPDIKNFLVNTGTKMYTWTTVYVYEWDNISFENIRDVWPVWNNPGGPGWMLRRQWQFQNLGNPITVGDGLYGKLPSDQLFQEDQLISIYHLQRVLGQMYVSEDNLGTNTIHHLTCHTNCHHRCHCARW